MLGKARHSSRAAGLHHSRYGIITTEDRIIDPRLLRFMYERAGATIVELKASHAAYLSQPRAVARVIERAARGK